MQRPPSSSDAEQHNVVIGGSIARDKEICMRGPRQISAVHASRFAARSNKTLNLSSPKLQPLRSLANATHPVHHGLNRLEPISLAHAHCYDCRRRCHLWSSKLRVGAADFATFLIGAYT